MVSKQPGCTQRGLFVASPLVLYAQRRFSMCKLGQVQSISGNVHVPRDKLDQAYGDEVPLCGALGCGQI